MSTRIFNGYRLPESRPVPAVAREFAEAIKPAYREATVKALTITSLLMLVQTMRQTSGPATPDLVDDEPDLKDPNRALIALSYGMCDSADIPTSGSILNRAADYLDLLHRRSREKAHKHQLDRDVSVTFVSDPADTAWTLALLYTTHEPYEQAWEALDGVEPWPYWNVTDRPDDVSEDEWEQRRQAWDRAIGWMPPALVGVSWELTDNVDVDVLLDEMLRADVIAGVWSVLNETGRARYSNDQAQLAAALTTDPDR